MKHADFRKKNVLEVGCGDGRLTFSYADLASRVVALDPEEKSIKKAKSSMPRGLADKPEFRVGRGQKLPFPDEGFAIIFLTWSLCCMATRSIKGALEEAWRVLKLKGMLVNIQPSLHLPFVDGYVRYIIEKNPEYLVTDEDKQSSRSIKNARLALKRVALIDRRFDIFAEEEITVNIYFDTVREARKYFVKTRQKEYRKLGKEGKNRILRTFAFMRTAEGIRTQENGVVTLLQKVQRPG
jgi:ubiquinone/menaquinone biosynthesis C-methylase UbiE